MATVIGFFVAEEGRADSNGNILKGLRRCEGSGHQSQTVNAMCLHKKKCHKAEKVRKNTRNHPLVGVKSLKK